MWAHSLPRAPARREVTSVTVRFCRTLRERGVLATPADSVDALWALAAVDFADRDDVYFALRAVLPKRHDELAIFDKLFEEWFHLASERKGARGEPVQQRRNPPIRPPTDEPRVEGAGASLRRWVMPDPDADEDDTQSVATPSTHDAPGVTDFSDHTGSELGAIEQVAARIARRLRARPGRRWTRAARGERVDLRRLLRLTLKTGGTPVELAYRSRKPRRTKLVVMCDISGSMDLYSRFLLQFLFALQGAFARVETLR